MSRTPAWKEDFPISWVDDDFVTRREFTKSLVWVSCASFMANVALAGRAAMRGHEPLPPRKVADCADLAIGEAHVFHYPNESDPCVLVRLSEDGFVAFGQNCTHLGCPVLYQAQTRRLECPCHEGAFDAASGHVISGPPPRPLPVIALERRGHELWAIGRSA
jgi:Rieske Fe-S protein